MSQKMVTWVTVIWGIIAFFALFSGSLTLLDVMIVVGYSAYMLAVYPRLRQAVFAFLSTRFAFLLGREQQEQIIIPDVNRSTMQELKSDFPFEFPEDTQEIKPVALAKLPTSPAVKIYTIKLSKGGEYRPDLAYALVQKLTSLGQIALRITAADNAVRWQVVDVSERHEPSLIVQAIRSVYPDATVEVADLEQPAFSAPFHRLTIFFKQSNIFAAPIRYAKEMKNDDPVSLIANTLSHVLPGERVSYVVYVGKPDTKIPDQALKQITLSKWEFRDAVIVVTSCFTIVGSVFAAFYLMWRASTGKRRDKYRTPDMNVFYEKLSDTLFSVCVGIQIDSPEAEKTVHYDIEPAMRQFGNIYQKLVAHVPNQGTLDGMYYQITNSRQERQTDVVQKMHHWGTNPQSAPAYAKNILNTAEVASIWHVPHEAMQAYSIEWARGKQVPMPAHARGKREGVCLGTNTAQGRAEAVWLPYASRTTPMMIFGKAGVGKSNLMHQMIHQDILADKSVVVIDPHGALVRDILQRSIPPWREEDVVLLDLANTQNPPPLNPLRGLSGEVAVARTVDIFNKLYPNLQDLPQTSDALENALVTLQGLPDAILWDVDRLFADDTFRAPLLAKSKDPVVRRFWLDEYEDLSKGERLNIRSPISRRLRRFYRSEDLRAIICHPQGIDFGQLVQQGKIVLISLHARENTIPEQEQRLLGALIVSRLQMAAMSEAFINVPCYCYIDELQNFVTSSIDQVFSEARKFNLSLTMANQYLQQLKGNALQAAMGNVSTLVVFQVGQEDAHALSAYTRPGFAADDLTSLDKFNAALWMRFGSTTDSAFSLATPLPVPRPGDAERREERIRALSVQQYTPLNRDDVMQWLEKRDAETEGDQKRGIDDDEEWLDNSEN